MIYTICVFQFRQIPSLFDLCVLRKMLLAENRALNDVQIIATCFLSWSRGVQNSSPIGKIRSLSMIYAIRVFQVRHIPSVVDLCVL